MRPSATKERRRDEFDMILEGINQMAEELSHVETLQTDFISKCFP